MKQKKSPTLFKGKALKVSFGALLLLGVCHTSPARQTEPASLLLALELYTDGQWTACRTECARVLSDEPTHDTARLLKALSEKQLGRDSSDDLEALCDSALAAVANMARYELARHHWQANDPAQAASLFQEVFQGTDERDLFLRAGCSLDLLLKEHPALRKTHSSLAAPLATSRPLWTSDIQHECRVSGPKKKRARSGRPMQWGIAFYRRQIRPALGSRCSLTPSCSEYAKQALARYGAFGLTLYADRAVREPDVIHKKETPVRKYGRRLYADPLDQHVAWWEPPSPPAPKPQPFLLASLATDVSTTAEQPTSSDPTDLALALNLAREKSHTPAAVEFRRLAARATDPKTQAGLYWAAAYQYLLAREYSLLARMLDRAEDAANDITPDILLLRAESAFLDKRAEESKFYLESMLKHPPSPDAKTFATRRLSHLLAADGQLTEAAQHLAESDQATDAQQAITAYATGRDKRPWLGAVLGIIPGLGYAYAGETGNAVRSLLLNAIFICGMMDAAHHENWGVFSAITFFELTWYTGSIYGGIDATHRYNNQRLATCLEAIDGSTRFEPVLTQLPVVTLQFEF